MAVKRRKEANTQSEASPADAHVNEQDHGTSIPYRRMVIRFIVVVGSMVALNLYLRGQGEHVFASSKEVVPHRAVDVPCSQDYRTERSLFPACIPKRCGRAVMDTVVSEEEAKRLLQMAKSGLALGGSSGGASILDIHSGALSKGDQFVNIYKIMQEGHKVFSEEDFKLYRRLKDRILRAIAKHFGVPQHTLFLTSPTFFSQMTTKPSKTVHDEYWHVHVDKETYGSFHYTSLLYLSDYGTDFHGGRFVFVDSPTNSTIEPKLGRLSFFTSGSENPHYVEQLTDGVRYAVTVSFTCDPNKAIADPVL